LLFRISLWLLLLFIGLSILFSFPWRVGLNFINVLRTVFTFADHESVKRYLWINCIFYAFGIYERKSCTKKSLWNWHQVSISSTFLHTNFLCEYRFGSFSSYMYLVKAAETTFVRKICLFNVDEIDTKSKRRTIDALKVLIPRRPNQ